jgi:hypothetical protein
VGDPQPVPSVGVPASDLLLDNQPFPLGWIVFPCDPDCGDAERADIARRDFVGPANGPGHALQDVFHFANEDDALAKFKRYEASVAYSSPLEVTYLSPIADEQFLHCGLDEISGCRAGLQYGNYFVYFYFDIDDGEGRGLGIEEVEPILRAMDERVIELLHTLPPS